MSHPKGIKVAHVLKDMVIGGIQTLLLDILSYYESTGQEFILVGIGGGEARELFEKDGRHCYFLKKKLPFLDPQLIIQLRKILLKEKVDVVHAHHTSEGIAAYLATRGTMIKFVQSFHVAPQINNSRDQWAFKKLATRMDAGVVPSKSQFRELAQSGYSSSTLEVIYNGVYPDRLRPQGTTNLRKELGLNQNHILLGMIGNFYNDTRDQLTICKALPKVFERFPDARFVFFGGHQNKFNPEPSRYEACIGFCRGMGIEHKVFFPGVETDL